MELKHNTNLKHIHKNRQPLGYYFQNSVLKLDVTFYPLYKYVQKYIKYSFGENNISTNDYVVSGYNADRFQLYTLHYEVHNVHVIDTVGDNHFEDSLNIHGIQDGHLDAHKYYTLGDLRGDNSPNDHKDHGVQDAHKHRGLDNDDGHNFDDESDGERAQSSQRER